MSSTKVTILGCGSSGGVPRIGNIWGNCDPQNPKNWRRRCSILIERQGKQEVQEKAGKDGREDGKNHEPGVTRVLIDASPDLRMQLLDAGVGEIDGVVLTHEHADHIGGIDDLRQITINRQRLTDVYMSERVWNHVVPRFSYCFEQPPGSFYKPILKACGIVPYKKFSIAGEGGEIELLPIDQQHGQIRSLAFRIGDFCYSNDVSHIPEQSVPYLEGVKIWVVDALKREPHKTHFNVETALSWIERIGPERAILTNLYHSLDYEELRRSLPENVEPAYDGMTIEID